MSLAFALEKQVAISAILRACSVTSAVFNKLVKSEKLTKDDNSPVTVGDFAAQAVVNTILQHAFPQDPIISEEDSNDLRGDSANALRNRVVELANQALTEQLVLGDSADWGIGPGQSRTTEEILTAIDKGQYEGGRSGRMWTLDPIDGTKGFLRGGQYAVCLALLVDAKVQVGVMGCPNLALDPLEPEGEKGCLFVAVRGQGAEQRSLLNGNPTPLKIASSLDNLNFLESYEAAHSSHGFNDRVARVLGVSRPPIRIDSQAKYCVLARGEGAVYLRMPVGSGYREKIWDHASGSLLVEMAGGIITDSRGQLLNFGLGRTLGENYGVVAAGKEVHAKILAAIQQVKSDESTHL